MPDFTPAATSSEASPTTIVGELRKQYGAHFAAGYGDNDTLGEVLGRAGVSTLDDYLKQHNRA